MRARPLFRYAMIAMTSIALSIGCAFEPVPPTMQEQILNVDRTINDGGYSSASVHEIDTLNEVWNHDGKSVEVALVAPREAGVYPLVVYFPGLGEHADGGRLWREHWAKAGYVVFSIQPLAVASALAELQPAIDADLDHESPGDLSDQDAMTDDERDERLQGKRAMSKSGRISELRYLGREHFSPSALSARIADVVWCYQQFTQRAQRGQGAYAKADPARAVVAGYDIGAQTAAALIGEKAGIDLPSPVGWAPQAAILISPFVDPANGVGGDRFHDIAIPLLTVISERDNDPYAITSPSLRTSIWDHAPDGGKYLLLLKSADHRLLSGGAWSRRPRPGGTEKQFDATEMPRFGQHFRSGGRPQAGVIGGKPHDTSRPMDEPDYRQIAAIFSVSNAFLDSVGKADNFAQLWLHESAQAWLKTTAEFKSK